jgi:hypothetical protein
MLRGDILCAGERAEMISQSGYLSAVLFFESS